MLSLISIMPVLLLKCVNQSYHDLRMKHLHIILNYLRVIVTIMTVEKLVVVFVLW